MASTPTATATKPPNTGAAPAMKRSMNASGELSCAADCVGDAAPRPAAPDNFTVAVRVGTERSGTTTPPLQPGHWMRIRDSKP